MLFQFLSTEDRDIIESRYWIMGEGSLVLKRWYAGFDLRIEKLLGRHLWVIILGFPIQCWNLKGFTTIANSIGLFMLIEDD